LAAAAFSAQCRQQVQHLLGDHVLHELFAVSQLLEVPHRKATLLVPYLPLCERDSCNIASREYHGCHGDIHLRCMILNRIS
jgi:hypothetical protein